jgi:hypothetical protein
VCESCDHTLLGISYPELAFQAADDVFCFAILLSITFRQEDLNDRELLVLRLILGVRMFDRMLQHTHTLASGGIQRLQLLEHFWESQWLRLP